MATELEPVFLKNMPDKVVYVPVGMGALAARAYAVNTGQATWEEVNGEPAANPGANGAFDAAMISAGKTFSDLGSNVRQLWAAMTGNEEAEQREIQKQATANRQFAPLQDERPVSTFVGGTLPYFAVPGGKVAQIGAGAIQGGLEGDTLGQRLGGAALGAGLSLAGQKAGDYLGMKAQNAFQRMSGNPNAAARKALIDAGVPLSLSQRTDSAVSKPLARFFERGRFVLTGNQPKGAAQQRKMTELITDALGIKAKKLTREAIGKAVKQNDEVFQSAAQRAGGKFFPDDELFSAIDDVAARFDEIGTDSAQVGRIFDNFRDLKNSNGLDGINARKLLRLRSNLSEATTKTDVETSAVVDALNAVDDLIARNVPDLAADLRVARDRFRLLLAVRRGAALSPQGDINVQTFTKNLERIFRDFDANVPLPRSLGPAGEAVAGINQVVDPFRSSATAENLSAIGIPGAGGVEPSLLLKGLLGMSAPFAGGGTGGVVGGGTGRAAADPLMNLLGISPEQK